MKVSSVAWGHSGMDFSYPTRPLNAFAKLLSGGTPSKAKQEFWNGDIPWITPKDMGDWNDSTANHVTPDAVGNGTRLAPIWTSYIAVRGMSLHKEIRVVRAPFPATFNQDIKAVEVFDGVNNRFLYYCLVAHKPTLLEKVESAGHGTGRLPTDQLEALKIPDVNDDISVSIAKVLGDLDDKIDLLRQMNTTLEEIARTVFRAWFIEFEPVRVKAEGATSFRGMPQDLFDALPDGFIPSEIGDIPAGWTVEPIGSLADCVGGGTPSTKNPAYWEDGAHPFCTPKDMSRLSSVTLLDTERHLTDAGVDKISSGSLPVGTVLLSSRAPIGYIAINYRPVSINQGIIAMKPTVVPAEYLRFWLEANMETIKANAGGTTFAEINKSKFRPILALRPCAEATAHYSKLTRNNLERVAANELEIQTLTKIRDTLLPKLISGELEAPSLEALGLQDDTS